MQNARVLPIAYIVQKGLQFSVLPQQFAVKLLKTGLAACTISRSYSEL